MHRCYVAANAWAGSELTPAPEESHHLLDVLRLKSGDEVEVFDGRGRKCPARLQVERPDPSRPPVCRLVLLQEAQVPRRALNLTLVQAIPKGKRIEFVLEKGTELGMAAFLPVVTQRVISRPVDKAEARRERWQKIARNAARQCGTPWIPQVDAPRPYNEVLQEVSRLPVLLLASLSAEAQPLRDVLATVKASAARDIGIIIGPEGDLTDEEHAAACAAGAIPVSFGPLVLRVETASIYALSVIRYELQQA